MGDGIDEAVVLLVATDLPHQKAGVENQPGGNRSKEDDAEKNLEAFAPVENDPAKSDCHRNRRQAHSEREKENYRATAAGDPHGQILPPLRGMRPEVAKSARVWGGIGGWRSKACRANSPSSDWEKFCGTCCPGQATGRSARKFCLHGIVAWRSWNRRQPGGKRCSRE